MLRLHSFSHSSASYRLRIALALKGLAWELSPVSLVRNEHLGEAYIAMNPQARVPTLETDDGLLTQSLAIIEWLDETHPAPPLLPADPYARAQCRAFAHVIVSDIFPVQNLGVRRKLAAEFGADEATQARWCADWIARGFAALESETAERGWSPGQGYLFGPGVTLADICLVPQMNNARRYGVDLAAFPLLVAADAAARAHPAFVATAPETQTG
jgi:maleylpyruvate isomerase